MNMNTRFTLGLHAVELQETTSPETLRVVMYQLLSDEQESIQTTSAKARGIFNKIVSLMEAGTPNLAYAALTVARIQEQNYERGGG